MIVQGLAGEPKIASELLNTLRSGLVALAACRQSRSATLSDLDFIVCGLNASTGWRISLAEGTAFPHKNWTRGEGGWRLREGNEGVVRV